MRHRTGWQYATVSLGLAAVAAVISYRDGLFVARLAGNRDDQAYLYPFLPDGLIVVCLLALYEASRAKMKRSRWAMGGLVLGIVLTLAQNVYAGLAHTVLDAVLDGMVPVVFFIAVEVVLWHVRRGRGETPHGDDSRLSPATTEPARDTQGQPPSAWLDDQIMVLLSRMSLRSTADAFGVSKTRVETAKRRAALTATESPAGDPRTRPAGVSGRDNGVPPGPVPAALNGHRDG